LALTIKVHTAGIEALNAFYNKELESALRSLKAMEDASIDVMASLEKMAKSGHDNQAMLCTHQ